MIINVGSINIDHVYRVSQMPKTGETISALNYQQFLGGKGINQSIAIARSGGDVLHIGAVGPDGNWALDQTAGFGIDLSHIETSNNPTGHAVICVDDAGDNQIVIFSGANLDIDVGIVSRIFKEHAAKGSWALVQNETNATAEIARCAKDCGLKLAYSAAPFDAKRIPDLLPYCDLLAVNEIEASETCQLLGTTLETIGIPTVLVTKGKNGAEFHSGGDVIHQDAFKVDAVDTTGAGDTFLGAFLAHLDLGSSASASLRYASAASALQVTRPGAAAAIPDSKDVHEFLDEMESR